MNKLVLVVAVAGCWSSSSSGKQAEAPAPTVASEGDATYGGATYGGMTYGGATYGVIGTLQPSGGAFGSITGTGDLDDNDVYGGLLGNEVGEMEGGWGTIGTGTYGTIGHGSGTGSGYGTGGGRGGRTGRGGPPVARIGNASASAGLDKNVIRRYIRRQLARIKYCYEKELVSKPDLRGTVVVDFTIGVDGKVSSSAGRGVDPSVAACVASAVQTIEFPRPHPANPVVVRYPFVLSPG